MPSTSFTIFTTVSTDDAAPVEVPATAESDEGAGVEPSPAMGLVARFEPIMSSTDHILREDKQGWEVNGRVNEASFFTKRGIVAAAGRYCPHSRNVCGVGMVLQLASLGIVDGGRDRADLKDPKLMTPILPSIQQLSSPRC